MFGSADGFGTTDEAGRSSSISPSFPPDQGFIIQGDGAGDQAGRNVSPGGDVNGDGFDDIIVGAYKGDDGGDDAGEVYVIFGNASGFGTPDETGRNVIDLTTPVP